MSTEHFAALKAAFEKLTALEPGAEREALLDELCAEDAALRIELEELLQFDDEGDDLLPGAVLRSDLDALWDHEGSILEGADQEVPARYEILRPLGEGGFGTVYLAREKEPIARQVAIKVIKPGMDTREVLARFDSERRALGTMEHPGIARVFAAGSDQRGRPYFVMEYVEGEWITEFCDHNRMSIRERLELFIEVCHAIQHAHSKGIVHRDIKPANVLVMRVDGRPSPKVIDFGIAKATDQGLGVSQTLTRQGQLIGTPISMSPEQAQGGEVDTRADVYALGGLLYEMLSGFSPLAIEESKTGIDDLRRFIIDTEPSRPSARLPRDTRALAEWAANRGIQGRTLVRQLSTDLDWIALKALDKEPGRRYASANSLAADVERFLANEPVAARPPSRSYQATKFARRHRLGLSVMSLVVLLLVAGTIGTAIGWRRSLRTLELLRAQEVQTNENLGRAIQAEAEARQQTVRAREAADLAAAINAFLNEDLLSAVSPESAGYDVTMRQVLDAAAMRIPGRFDRNPRVERAIRNTLGRTYRALALTSQAEEQLLIGLATSSAIDREGRLDEATNLRERGSGLLELGRVRLQENKNAAAEEILRSLWEECSAVLGDEDLLTIDALHFLGVSIAEQERFEEAAEIFDLARSSSLAAYGEQHELSIQALHSQGLLDLSRSEILGRPLGDETLQLLEQALEASRDLHGSDDPRSVRRIIDFAFALFAAGDNARALSFYEEAHERSRRVQGPGHPTTAVTAVSMGRIHSRVGRLDLAEPLLEEGLSIALTLRSDQPILLVARHELAVCRMRQGRIDEALELAYAAYESQDEDSPRAAWIAALISELYSRSGQPEAALEWSRLADRPDGGH